MGTTSDKLTYLNDTKNLLRQGINAIGGEIETTDIFRSYVDELENIYEELPKVTGSGTSVTLNNTRKGGLRVVLNPSELEQATTTGKNLLPISTRSNASNGITSTANADGTLTLNGTTTATWFTCNSENVNIPAGTYTFSIQEALTYTIRLDLTYSDSTTENSFTIVPGNTSRTITTEKDISSFFIECYDVANGTHINKTLKLQLESGSSPTSWEKYTGGLLAPSPTYPQTVHTITGDNEIKIENKNLFDKDGTDFDGHTGINNFNGKQIASNTFVSYTCYDLISNNARCQAYFKGKAGQTYYLSFGNKFAISTIKAFGSDGIITATLATQNTISMTTDYIGITLKKSDSSDFTDAEVLELKNSIQIELGSTASSYVSHQEQVYEINLGKNLAIYSEVNDLLTYANDCTSNSTGEAKKWWDIVNNLPKDIEIVGSWDYTGDGTAISGISGVRITFNYTDGSSQITNKGTAFTIPSSKTINYIYVYGNQQATSVKWSNIQFEKGTTPTEYTPYFTPIEYCEIGDYADKIDRSSGKNLFDKDNATYQNGKVKNDSGVETTENDFGYLTSYISVKPNTTYTIQGTLVSGNASSRLYYYDNSKSWLSRSSTIGASAFPYTFTTPNNCYYLQFQYYRSAYNENTIMINEDTIALPYEPYGTKWYIKKNIGKKILIGAPSEGWYLDTTNKFRTSYDLFTDRKFMSTSLMGLKLNYYKVANSGDYYARWRGANETSLSIFNKDISTAAEFETWLSTHNTIIYYVLNTPTYTLLNDTLQTQLEDIYNTMKSYNGQTNISQVNNDLPFNMLASALESFEE